jgi:SAM-dependent methyltransferase
MSELSLIDWHHRYRQQAIWTKDIRNYLLDRAMIRSGNSILDVGCGTGVINQELEDKGLNQFGLDIDFNNLKYAFNHVSSTHYVLGDAHNLPYEDNSFDVVLCHFLLLWVNDPKRVLEEMTRVGRQGSSIFALAEPDYGGRIDHPLDLAILGKWQTQSLKIQGANPLIGRQLPKLFKGVGLESVETGILGGQWSCDQDWDSWHNEWQILEADLEMVTDKISPTKISALKELEKKAYINGERVLYIPTFYAWGIVK